MDAGSGVARPCLQASLRAGRRVKWVYGEDCKPTERHQMREAAKKFMSEKVKRRPGKQPGAAGAAPGSYRARGPVPALLLRGCNKSRVPQTSHSYHSLRPHCAATGFSAVPARHQPGTANRDAYNLLCCIRDRRHEVTRYWADPAMPATNNQAERDLRMVKLQGRSAGDVLVQLFKGTTWMPPRAVSPP